MRAVTAERLEQTAFRTARRATAPIRLCALSRSAYRRRSLAPTGYSRQVRFVRFDFQGFKSLRDVTLSLEDVVTVVTGANGAGKTNLAEALTFLSESLQYGLEIAVARAGGFANLAHHSDEGDTKSVQCQFLATLRLSEVARGRAMLRREYGAEDKVLFLLYAFELTQPDETDPTNFKVALEYFHLRDSEGAVLKASRIGDRPIKFWRSKRMKGSRTPLGAGLYPLSDDNFIKYAKERVDDTTLVVQAVSFSNNLFSLMTKQLGQLKVFQLSPHLCRQPGISTPNAILSRHGENLPSVVNNLKRNTPDIWGKIENAMQAILPQLETIDTSFTQDRRLSLTFKMKNSDRPWNANEMSDGTIQALALFVALFDRRSPVLIVEEPENALHPWILRHFLDLCRSQNNKQILLTTHSPVVIDYTAPENLRVMWNRDGESHLSSVLELNSDIVDLWKSGEVSTFDIYDSGFIHEYLPEEYVPSERGE